MLLTGIKTFAMRIDIITVVPELLESPLSHSIVGRAIYGSEDPKGAAESFAEDIRTVR